MFDQLGWSEVGVLLLLALFVFGPERLPTLARDAGQFLRKVRLTVKGLTDDLKTELGPEVRDLDLAALHPKTFVKTIFEDDEQVPLDKPASARMLPVGEPAPWDPDTT